MVDIWESDKIIKISGKAAKSNTHDRLVVILNLNSGCSCLHFTSCQCPWEDMTPPMLPPDTGKSGFHNQNYEQAVI